MAHWGWHASGAAADAGWVALHLASDIGVNHIYPEFAIRQAVGRVGEDEVTALDTMIRVYIHCI